MRRVLLFAAFLLLLGLSTAMAASFEVQAEDITSFTTDVSISVPATNDVVFYIKNNPNQQSGDDPLIPGLLDSNPPGNNNVDQKQIVHDSLLVDASHTDPTKYHAWQSGPLPNAVTVGGTATLYISSNGAKNELHAGLFECWVPAPDEPQPSTIDGDLPAGVKCALIGEATSTGGTNSNGYTERTALLPLANTAVEAGHTLRLKVVNNSPANWNLQWGFNPARPSQLQLKVYG